MLDRERERSLPVVGNDRKSSTFDRERERLFLVFENIEMSSILDGERERSLPVFGDVRKSSIFDRERERLISVVFGSCGRITKSRILEWVGGANRVDRLAYIPGRPLHRLPRIGGRRHGMTLTRFGRTVVPNPEKLAKS